MWGMLVLIIILMVIIFFHLRGTPPKDMPAEDAEIEGDESLEDYAARIAKMTKEDPNYTPYN